MEIERSVAVEVREPTDSAEVRRRAVAIANECGFESDQTGKISIVATEMATNLLRHANSGEMIVQKACVNENEAVELLSLDRGPGIANVSAALRDGHSTVQGSGTGLGAIRRMASHFELHTAPNQGTVLLARFHKKNAGNEPPTIRGISVPKRDETVSGDGWYQITKDNISKILVVDGLGHGPLAAEAAIESVNAFVSYSHLAAVDILNAIHSVLRSTRGAAAAIAELRPEEHSLKFAGIGNITGVIISGEKMQNMVSHNGTLGHTIHKPVEFHYGLPQQAVVILHSDGLSARWNLSSYAGATSRDPLMIAGFLYRDFRRSHDDATVVVAKPFMNSDS